MTTQFADAYYLLALVNLKDKDHASAVLHSHGPGLQLITTTWVLMEFADALAAVNSRLKAAQFIRGFLADPFVEVIPPTREQFQQALNRYERRPDKDWSLTDCASFLLMEERQITDALTADHHFEQAGFRALLRE